MRLEACLQPYWLRDGRRLIQVQVTEIAGGVLNLLKVVPHDQEQLSLRRGIPGDRGLGDAVTGAQARLNGERPKVSVVRSFGTVGLWI